MELLFITIILQRSKNITHNFELAQTVFYMIWNAFLIPLFSQDIAHDFELKLEVYCHKQHEELCVANTPKKIRKKITDISGSVGRSVGKRLSGLVSS